MMGAMGLALPGCEGCCCPEVWRAAEKEASAAAAAACQPVAAGGWRSERCSSGPDRAAVEASPEACLKGMPAQQQSKKKYWKLVAATVGEKVRLDGEQP